MWKKSFIIAISLLLICIMGCTYSLPTGDLPEDLPNTAPTEADNSSSEESAESDREAHTELSFYLDNSDVQRTASLHCGENYSIYILDEGWSFSTQSSGDITVDSWESTDNSMATLQVVSLGKMSLEDAKAWANELGQGFELSERKQGGYLGSDDGDKNLMEMDFVEVDGQIIAIALKYPMEETEGLGTCIRVMADTFAVEK